MKNLTSDVRFLVLSTAIVALVGVQTVMDLASEEPVSAIAAASITPRTPASVPKTGARPASPSWKEPMLEWNCGKESPKPFTVDGRHFRLKGKGCAEFKSLKLSIVNESNGFTASIFDKGTMNYETDLIPLREGENRIRVQYWASPARKTDAIVVVHSPQI